MNQPVVLNFDASTVDPATALSAIPANDYVVILAKAEPEATRKGDGHYLHCDFIVQEGEFKGRHLYKNLNLWNPSEQAKEIAWRELSGIAHACNVLQVPTIDVLFNIPMMAKVIVEADAQYGDTNRIKGFSVLSTGPAPVAGGAAAPPWGPPGTAAPAPAAPAPAAPMPGPVAPGAAPPPPAPAPAPTPAPAPAPGTTGQPPWAAAAPAADPGQPAAPAAPVNPPPAPATDAPGAAPPWAEQATSPAAAPAEAAPPWAS